MDNIARTDAGGPEPFVIKDCSIITISTGLRALNLRELHARLTDCPSESIEYHFYLTKLRPAFDDPEYPNDFAAWAYHGLHNRALAERLGMLSPADYLNTEALRAAALDLMEDELSQLEHVTWAKPQNEFIFLSAQTVIFDTGKRARTPAALAELVPTLSTGSVYYHFIEARRRLETNLDDYTTWIRSFGEEYAQLAEILNLVEYHFCSLSELRE
ncbi:MAG TPA: DUF5752 family protein, partial [candidate division Zixibacteria bacterium]|nr:DUF5752 family protein [candidate division Zixibacteria bacterium]